MVIIRKQKSATQDFNLKELEVGDQIEIGGLFTATVQRIHNKKAYILFDDCIATYQMNEDAINDGGFEKSDLNKLLQMKVLPAFPQEIRERIKSLTIPTFGQIFGHNTGTRVESSIVVDKDKQFELMKSRKNRIADFKNKWAWYWLRNATKKSVSSACFAVVGGLGSAHYLPASNSYGVRPLLIMDI